MEPAAISARPAMTMMRVVVSAPESPAASANGNGEPVGHPDDDVAYEFRSREVRFNVRRLRHILSSIAQCRNSRAAAICSGVPSATIWPPRVAALGAQVDHPVGAADHVQIVLDDQDAAAVFDQALEGRQQLGDVVEVQAGGGLVEDEQRAVAGGLRQVRGQLHALRFAAAKAWWRIGPAADSPGRRRPAPSAGSPAAAMSEKNDSASCTVSCSTSWMFRPL